MGFHLSRNLNMGVRQFWTTSFQYALLVTAALAPKLIHLWTHRASLPPVITILYLPTFMGLDVINAIVFWILVHLGQVRTPIWLKIVRGIISLTILGTSAMQIAFYLETGGEIKWGAAGNFAHDPAGIKVLLSGSMQAALVSTAILILARIISYPLYYVTDSVVRAFVKAFTGRDLRTGNTSTDAEPESSPRYLQVATADEEDFTNYAFSQGDDLEASGLLNEKKLGHVKWYSVWITRTAFLAPFAITVFLCILRPTNFPYAHMSSTLPYTLVDIWIPVSNLCRVQHSGDYTTFPLTELISEESWERPNGRFPGWMPRENVSSLESAPLPPWLPKNQLDGFERWYLHEGQEKSAKGHGGHGGYGSPEMLQHMFKYDPVQDPLRITNLDQEVLQPIVDALKDRKIAIKHIVLLTMESTRGDFFPLKKGSFTYENIMKTHGSDTESLKKAEMELAQLTVNAELLTGVDGGFVRDNKTNSIAGSWKDLKADRGGINILGSMTGSTTSFKSVVGAHCGLAPLPVDFTIEAQQKIYQPCVPQILSLFNQNKPKGAERKDVNSMPWRSVFAQSITDQFDKQDQLNRHMGWSDVIVKGTLLEPGAKYPPTEKEANYFGYPESQIKPYLHDLFRDAMEGNQRLFLSHMTSSTHHPWNTPEGTETVNFLKRGKYSAESHFNRYLNTIKYADRWIGEVMDMLQDIGVGDETLVVMVGDHGWAFPEDTPEHSTFENGHVANLRVPLVFHHPSMPRIQLALNATSISIIPTILDLLVATSSLSPQDTDIASNLIHQYEGQSLIRPYQTTKAGRQAWNIAVLNTGGAVLSVSSAAVPFRLIIPVCTNGVYRFTDISRDPYELAPILEFSIEKLANKIRRQYNDDAASKWLREADEVGRYWVLEQRRRWRI